jgi:hypothetical protein
LDHTYVSVASINYFTIFKLHSTEQTPASVKKLSLCLVKNG